MFPVASDRVDDLARQGRGGRARIAPRCGLAHAKAAMLVTRRAADASRRVPARRSE
jgi:hypothetical protein